MPTVRDRVIQQAIAQVLSPLFDVAFSERSFGFRYGRRATDPYGRWCGGGGQSPSLPDSKHYSIAKPPGSPRDFLPADR